MTFPVVQSITPSSSATSSTSNIVSMPATVTAEDLLVVHISVDNAPTITTPENWNQLAHTAVAAVARLGLYYKVAVGSEGGTTVNFVSNTAQSFAAHCYRITNWVVTSPPEVGTANTGSSVNPNSPSLTPSWGAADTLWIAVATTGASSSYTAFPEGYEDGVSLGAGLSVSAASAQLEFNAATEDPGPFTIAASVNWGANTVAVRGGGPLIERTILRLSSSSSLTDS